MSLSGKRALTNNLSCLVDFSHKVGGGGFEESITKGKFVTKIFLQMKLNEF